jgi:hypothetical protein
LEFEGSGVCGYVSKSFVTYLSVAI